MTTIKSYTDLEQSKKLAKILPLESADMFYNEEPEDETYPKDIVDTEYPMILKEGHIHFLEEYGIPCWSLAALINILPLSIKDDIGIVYSLSMEKEYVEYSNPTLSLYPAYIHTSGNNNLVDACYDMILKLNELNLL